MVNATINGLKKLESKINKAYYKSPNTEFFFDGKRASKYAQQWEAMMIELRGWSDYRYDEDGKDLMKQSWIEACGNTINPSYNLGDVCA
jgi:ABC-type glycerol-3-phosphate transport system substrate-binding protein